ncbi:MAG: HlyD family efflux transporter periplasmic adaptor subunit [Oscillospiraceae bacterium]|nr:HlyD family efflux transporter periplasmic adaptor subunit [Oscillospiraceae bacterium]
MEMTVKKRGWVKNAAIVFLAILLILTFFSNTIMNRSLAEVATQNVNGGSIAARVRGSGTVSAAGSYEVKSPQTREIRSVLVRTGDTVRQGDVLFIFGDGSSEELEQARETLETLQSQRQRMALGMSSYDYTLEEREIEALREKVEAASDEEALAYFALISSSDTPENILAEAEAKIEARQKDVDEAQQALEDAQADFALRQEEAQLRVDEALARLNELLDNPPEEETEESAAEYQRRLEEARAAVEAAQFAQAALDPASDPGIVRAQEDLELTKQRLAAAEEERDVKLSGAGALADDYARAKETRQQLEDELFVKEYNLEQLKKSNSKSAASAYLDLQDLDKQIEKAKAALESLSGGEENQIVANVSGIIESVRYTAGNTAPKGETVCTIQVPDLGYTVSFTVTSDQARRVRPGDSADITNYYGWGREIYATLATVRQDPQNPQNSRILDFNVTGDVSPGMELSLSVGSKSQYYDTVVPNSAVRSDTNGSFILVIEAKNSPLGNRYYAKRVDVTVLASDEMYSAVTGDLGYGDFVITTSNKPVSSGDMVRMPD